MRKTKANWFVIKTVENKEIIVANRLSEKLDPDVWWVRVPRKKLSFRKNGIETIKLYPSFPGYIFVVTECSVEKTLAVFRPLFDLEKDAFGFLHYGDDKCNITLHEADKALLTSIYDDDFTVGVLEAVKIGSHVEITDSVFSGNKGIVKYLDKHKQRVWVEFKFFNKIHCEKFAYKIIEIMDAVSE